MVDLRRAIAARHPATAELLAASLGDLGARLRDLGQHEGALAVIQEADELRRSLAARRAAASHTVSKKKPKSQNVRGEPVRGLRGLT